MLQIYNSMTQQKELFKPLKDNHVGLYVCGMTVYDLCHIGHGRMLVVFDMVARYLRWRGFDVCYVRNITDIDDKIINRAQKLGEDPQALAQRYIEEMHQDERALDVLPPDKEPQATSHIDQIIAMIQQLVDKHYAYIADNGDVYYDITKFADYGKLAHQNLDEMIAGARVEVVDAKRHPLDFVLWKMAKPGEPSWDSPWGAGRPGWHIECSAMSTHCLGNHFDIHGGGFDLRVPHHQNEIAQAEAATGETFVNTWMHIGFVQVNAEKMSKSLGNFSTIQDVLKQYPAEVVRYFLLASHYRSQINYSQDNLSSAQDALTRFYLTLRDLPEARADFTGDYKQRFIDAMDDDFNTPVALAVLFEMARDINRLKESNKKNEASKLAAALKQMAGVIGILQHDPNSILKSDDVDAKQVETLIAERNQARKDKDWTKADAIRNQLSDMGVVIEDNPTGTSWRVE